MSPQLLANYLGIDNRHAKLTATLIKAIASIIIGCFILSAMLPISYAIIGYPEPDQWALPIEFRYDRNEYF